MAAAFGCFDDMDRTGRYTLKHKDEESGHLVNICDFEELKPNEKITIVLKPPGPAVMQQLDANNDNVQVNEVPVIDAVGGNEGLHDPRIDLGVLPSAYKLPQFPDYIIRKIERFGRRIDPGTKDEILQIIMKDMMRFSCYLYPKNYEYQRVVEKLVNTYPSLADASGEAGDGLGEVQQWFTWKCDLVTTFNNYRRSHGKNDPALQECREKLGISARKRPKGGARQDTTGARAKRYREDVINVIPTAAGHPLPEMLLESDTESTEAIRQALHQEWEKNHPNVNLIIIRLNLTAKDRQELFKNSNTNLKEALNLYPPLRDPFHISNDMERFYGKNILELIKDYFTEERCDRAMRILRGSKRAQTITTAYLAMEDCNTLTAKRDCVLAALPAVGSRENLSKWILVNKDPKGCGAVLKVESTAENWMDPDCAKFFVVVEGEKIGGEEFSITDAMACSVSLQYLFDLKFPMYVTGAWRFLAEHVCGLPPQSKSTLRSTQDYINLID